MTDQATTALLPEGQVQMELLSESVISEGSWVAFAVHQWEEDMLLVNVTRWRHDDYHTGDSWHVAHDGGLTWEPYVTSGDGRDHTRIRSRSCRRSDGSVMGWEGGWNLDEAYQGRPGQPIPQAIFRAAGDDALVRGEVVVTDASVCVPYLVPSSGDDVNAPPQYFVGNYGKMLETDHGYLLQAAYASLAYDDTPRRWAEYRGPDYQYRTYLLYSRDDGLNWQYLSTVAATRHHPLPSQAEGYCEPDLLYFGDGRLLCVMRTGGNPTGALMERYTPLVACRSGDGGLSWTPPEPMSAYGVNPVLLQMQNGLVVCLAGRPGFFLHFSADEGRTWSPPHWVSESHGPWGRSASGYGHMIELAPGVLGVAYDEHVGEGDALQLVTKFRRYQIATRDKAEA